MAITPVLPTPTLPSAGSAAVRTAGPVTHSRAASARSQETELEHAGARPLPGTSPGSRRTAGSAGGRGRGRDRRPPALTRLTATDPGATVWVSRLLARSLAGPPYLSLTQPRGAGWHLRGAHQASLSTVAHPQRDPAQPAFAVRLRVGAGPRACAPPSVALWQRLPGDVVFQRPFTGSPTG
uniref:Uncharacterized protein n=1 Tax=Molossus molossus TaxID=27622 RepID=A0A7J8HZZ2_MOLMO|nr:hypothetical protein HJG59_010836 [Molossus molossus]